MKYLAVISLFLICSCSSINIERNAPLIEINDSANGNDVDLTP